MEWCVYIEKSPRTWSQTVQAVQKIEDVTLKNVYTDLACLVIVVPSERSDIVNELRRMPGVTGVESNKGGHEKYL